MSNIVRIMKLNGWTQDDLGDATGLNQSTISKANSGAGVSLKNYKIIAKALDVPLYTLFKDDLSDIELRIIKAYRSASQSQKQFWEKLAVEAKDHSQKEDQ